MCHGLIHGLNRMNWRKLQRKGLELAKAQGKHLGRPKMVMITDNFIQQYNRWKNGEINGTRAIELSGMSRVGFYRMVKEHETKL